MITPELVTYVHQQLAAGISREDIKKSLVPNGWSTQDIAHVFATTPKSSIDQKKPSVPTSTGRKVLLSSSLVLVSAVYAFFQLVARPQQVPPIMAMTSTLQPTQPFSSDTTMVTQIPAANSPQPQPIVTPTPTSAPTQMPAGQYKNGTYTGDSADAYYGTVQVQAVVQHGALASVHILQYPNSHSTSAYINEQAIPILTSEAIQTQSANVNIISGATFTSQAFQQSLGSALSQA